MTALGGILARRISPRGGLRQPYESSCAARRVDAVHHLGGRALRAGVLCVLVVTTPSHAAGVVSLNLCTDQLLVLLAPEKVAGLEPLAFDPALSFVAKQAKFLPKIRADAEAVLLKKPDLVLAGRYGAPATVAVLRSRGVRVVQLDDAEDFAAIEAQTLALAALLGVPARGKTLIADMRQHLAAVHRTIPLRTALIWQASGWTAGPASLGGAVLREAGLVNIGTGDRIGLEGVLARPPDLLVTETAAEFPSLATDLVRHPALSRIRRAAIPPPLIVCGGPFSAEAVSLLAQ